MSVKEITGAFRSADVNGNKQVLYPMTKIDLVDGLRDYLESLEVSKTATGSVLSIDGSADLPVIGFSLYGKSTQNSMKGVNLLPFECNTSTVNGITFTVNDDDGTVLANGTASAQAVFDLHADRIAIDGGEYIISGCPTGGGSNTYNLCIGYYDADGTWDAEAYEVGNGHILETEYSDYRVAIMIRAGQTVSNLLFKPMINSGTVIQEYEPYCGGIPAPNPDYPQDIANIGDAGSVGVGLYGANLCNNIWESGSINNETGAELAVTIEVRTKSYIRIIPNVPYYLKRSVTTDYVKLRFYDKNYNYVGQSDDNNVELINGSSVANPMGASIDHATIRIINDDIAYMRIVDRSNNLNTRYFIGLYDGGIDVPYSEPQFLTVSTLNGLPGIKVTDASLANYTDADGNMWCCDEVDLGRGVYVKRVGSTVFDGSADENWTEFPTNTDGSYRVRTYQIQNAVCKPKTANDTAYILCSAYIACTANRTYLRRDGISIELDGAMTIYDNKRQSVANFRAYLESNPMTVFYVLATPIETPLSTEELAAFKALYMNKPNTTVLNNENAEMSLTYYSERYDAAIDFIIDKIENNRDAIQALKDVVEVTLLASNWSGSAAPYTQTVEVEGITEEDNPTLVTAMYDGITDSAKTAYLKAFSLIAAGTGETNNGSVTFSVSEKPTINIVVGLKGV